MTHCIKHFFILFIILFSVKGYSQLYINELSQGTGFTPDEFVEFVVVGDKTCTDSCFDLRGWIFDDNIGFYGSSGIAGGHFKFSNDPQWECVPYGSLIVVYNELNPHSSITDDPTDANNDKVYVLNPTNPLLVCDVTIPLNGTPFSNYTGANYTPTGKWAMMAMKNAGDLVQTVDPANLNTSVHSVGWGSNISGTDIYFSGSASNLAFIMNNSADNDPKNDANWSSIVTMNSTPGLPNNNANQSWITGMNVRLGSPSNPIHDTTYYNCMAIDSLLLNGRWYQTNFTFSDTTVLATGCSYIVTETHIFEPFFANDTIESCAGDSVYFNNQWYYNNTVLSDTTRLPLPFNCYDSIVKTHIIFNQPMQTTDSAKFCLGDSILLHGNYYNQSGIYPITLTNKKGCDSTVSYSLTYFNSPISFDTARTCQGDSLYFNNIWFKKDTTILIQYAHGACDSVVYQSILFNPFPIGSDTIFVCLGDSVLFNASWYSANDIMYQELIKQNGCDSLVYHYIIEKNTAIGSIIGDSVICIGSETVLALDAVFDSYLWSNGSMDYFIPVNTGGDYSVNYTIDGCTASDTITVYEKDCAKDCMPFVPNAFTINGDGLNDGFAVKYNENCVFSEAEYRIFNRWGDVIFKSEHISDIWNGTNDGQPVSSGVYVYQLRYRLQGVAVEVKIGTVSVLR